MASAEHPDSGDANALQFDHAEFTSEAPAAVVCGGCKRPVDDAYYELNQVLLCKTCRQAVGAHFEGGSKALRFIKATSFGFLAAIVGALILYAFTAITGYYAGIVSILVGYLVGRAVSKGANQRGGLVYQLLAVGLTYSAVAWSFIPGGLHQLLQAQDERADAAKAVAKDGQDPAKPEPQALEAVAPARSTATVVALVVVVFVFSYFVPVIGLPENLIGLLIIAFGLYQAWKLNRRLPLVVRGPFRVGAGGQPSIEVAAHG